MSDTHEHSRLGLHELAPAPPAPARSAAPRTQASQRRTVFGLDATPDELEDHARRFKENAERVLAELDERDGTERDTGAAARLRLVGAMTSYERRL